MRALILSDVHGNLPALEAILASPEAAACDRIISLGDHVNFGPQSRQVHLRLQSLGALMLLGNHEDRFFHLNEPEFAGYNWALLHFTVRQMDGLSVALPTDERIGSVWLTHGTPGDPYRLVHPGDLPAVLDALPPGVTHLISGHNHIPWEVTHNGRTAFNPCSAGIPEMNQGGVAPFAILELQGDAVELTRAAAAYDLRAVQRAYVETGAALAAPEMTRIVLRTMQTGEYQGVTRFVRHVMTVGKTMNLTLADREAWLAADRLWPWPEPLTSPEYWNKVKEELL